MVVHQVWLEEESKGRRRWFNGKALQGYIEQEGRKLSTVVSGGGKTESTRGTSSRRQEEDRHGAPT